MIANHADLIARLRAFAKVWGSAGQLQLYPKLVSTANEAADALASCDKALEEMTERAEGAEAQMELRRQWMDKALARANAAESALATERARVIEESAKAVREAIYGRLKAAKRRNDEGAAMELHFCALDLKKAIRALIPATTGATEPSASGSKDDSK